jgi:hypothetical protein
MSFSFKPALSAGEPGVILLITGSLYPQLLSLLISKVNPKLQVNVPFCADRFPVKITMTKKNSTNRLMG